MIQYRAWIKEEPIILNGRTNNSLVTNLKKIAGVDLRKHGKRVIFGEVFETFGIWFFDRKTREIIAGIEFDEVKS